MNLFVNSTIILFCNILLSLLVFAGPQTSRRPVNDVLDSLENRLLLASDTEKTSILNRLADHYLITSPERSLKYASEALEISVAVDEKIKMALSLNNIGRVYYRWSEYEKAIEYYQRSLKISESMDDKSGIAQSFGNIGTVYYDLGSIDSTNYLKSLDYYNKSLQIDEEIGNKPGIAMSINNIGAIYHKLKLNLEALNYYKKAAKLYEELEMKDGIARTFNNIGFIYYEWENFEKALDYYRKTLSICRELDHKYGIALSLNNMGDVYVKWKKYEEALEYYDQSTEVARSINSRERISDNYKLFSDVYDSLGDYKRSLEYYKLHTELKDSIFTEESNKHITEIQTKYETEKKDLEIRKNQSEIQRQKLMIYSLILVFILIVVFSVIVYRQYVQKKKANIILARQKQEITDSINCAQRLQSAILPSEEYVSRFIKDYFILFMPRDIVSGDFYWIVQKDNKILIASVDCTGHGVPGALMSIIGYDGLKQAVNEYNLIRPAEILDHLSRSVSETLQQYSDSNIRDGMDIALCSINENYVLEYSGAYNPVCIFSNNELKEIKADRFPIGTLKDEAQKKFTNHEVQLNKGDTFYIFSDGYIDQFGGKEEKKFKYNNFKNLLKELQNNSMKKQKEILEKTYYGWKGDLDQVDDILIIGVRI